MVPAVNSTTYSELLAMGLDGCRAGWVGALLLMTPTPRTQLLVFPALAAAIAFRNGRGPTSRMVIDMPIGLPDRVAFRACDHMARALLGPRIQSSVFQVPDRGLFGLTDFGQVQAVIAERSRVDPSTLGLSRQSFAILRKITEDDAYVTANPTHEQWLAEFHPEVSFRALTKEVLPRKADHAGSDARRGALAVPFRDIEDRIASFRSTAFVRDVALDDILDAFAGLWTAIRWRAGRSTSLGDEKRDTHGLPMRILI